MVEVPEITADSFHYKTDWKPMNYFRQYIADSIVEGLPEYTNRCVVAETGKSLQTTPTALKKIITVHCILAA